MATTKSPCPKCPSSDGFITWDNGTKHCFSCGYHEGTSWSVDNIRQYLDPKKMQEKMLFLPDDYSINLPDYAIGWLNAFHIDFRLIRRHRIGFSDRYQSIVFPVFGEDTNLKMYQLRYFGSDETIPKWKTMGHKPEFLYLPDKWPSSCVTIVEDIVSAIRVSQVTNAVPLFGSELSMTLALKLLKLYKRCRVWLDPDKKTKAMETALLLIGGGLPTTTIFTDHDPKTYLQADIRRIVDPAGE